MLRHLAVLITVSLLSFAGSGCSKGKETKYSIDMEGPSQLVCDLPYTTEVSEVRVYVTGPVRFFDGRPGLAALFSMDPIYRTTNSNDIDRLIESLMYDGDDKDIEASSSEYGYTYHILLMDTNALRAMEFMAFVPEDRSYESVAVQPRIGTGSLYKNAELVPWVKQWKENK